MKRVFLSILGVGVIATVLKWMKRETSQIRREASRGFVATNSGEEVWNWLCEIAEAANKLQRYSSRIDFKNESWVVGFREEITILVHIIRNCPKEDLVLYGGPVFAGKIFQSESILFGCESRLKLGCVGENKEILDLAVDELSGELELMVDLAAQVKRANFQLNPV